MDSKKIATTIINQLRAGTDGYNSGIVLMMCWGYRQPTIVRKTTEYGFDQYGVSFKVSGLFLKGTVEIVLDQGADMYNIRFLNLRGREVKAVEGVFFDDLTRIVDMVVEKEGFK